jgi:hypothetical protein
MHGPTRGVEVESLIDLCNRKKLFQAGRRRQYDVGRTAPLDGLGETVDVIVVTVGSDNPIHIFRRIDANRFEIGKTCYGLSTVIAT